MCKLTTRSEHSLGLITVQVRSNIQVSIQHENDLNLVTTSSHSQKNMAVMKSIGIKYFRIPFTFTTRNLISVTYIHLSLTDSPILGCDQKWDENVGLGKLGLGNFGTRGLGDLGREDVGTRRRAGTRRDKQTTPDFNAEFVKYNFWWLIVR